MDLIVEIEDFLEQARQHLGDASQADAVVLIRLPASQPSASRAGSSPPTAPDRLPDDDDLVTWEDAAWQ